MKVSISAANWSPLPNWSDAFGKPASGGPALRAGGFAARALRQVAVQPTATVVRDGALRASALPAYPASGGGFSSIVLPDGSRT